MKCVVKLQTRNTSMSDVIISIHPKYALAIADGHKTVEVRRRFPHYSSDITLWIYATKPLCSIVAFAQIKLIDRLSVEELWTKWGARTGIDQNTYYTYVEGTDHAVAVLLGDVTKIPPVPLSHLRSIDSTFHPPQVTARLNDDLMRGIREHYAR